jgi:hypothetical protein
MQFATQTSLLVFTLVSLGMISNPTSTSAVSRHTPGELIPIRDVHTGPVAPSVPIEGPIASRAGQVEVRTPDGATHYCSGLFVNSTVVLTAAHCLQENGTTTFYTVTAFRIGSAAAHTLHNNCIHLPIEWSNVTDEYLRIQYDYAFIKVTPGVTTLPGTFTISTGNPINNAVVAVGYPFTGAGGLQAINGPILRDALHPPLSSLVTSSLGFTRGTSGGAWVDQTGSSSQYRIYSVNSSYAAGISDQTTMRVYGPDFTDPTSRASSLLTAATGCL